MKILILSESIAGSGHTRAAENVAKGIRLHAPEAEIKIDSSLSHVSPTLEKWSSRLYMGAIRHAAPLWGWAYQRDREWSRMGKKTLNSFVARKIAPYIEKESPNIIISTHAFCLGGLAELKERYGFRLGAALTDYWVNPFWIHEKIDAYFVGAEYVKEKIIRDFSLEAHKIHVTGIPIDPSFSQPVRREGIREKYSIPKDACFVLISGGGMGILPYEEILEGLSQVDKSLFVAVLMGTNQQAKKKVESHLAHAAFPHPILLLDYVSNIHEWMKSADLLIGKPGGLTVSEALACHLPILIYRPIPGQEERNSRFLLEEQVGMTAGNSEELKIQVNQFIEVRKQELAIQIERMKRLAKPASAEEVGKIMLNIT
ncbi:glycosyltransferase [Ammoniphilus sp. YIM 78166]|uniref:MGDG synthase family glycosyltransferase n=1 Tax=Ammoniphilus sp. YIM 78166 TaxID=1644106 RepID=UPI00107050F0|nr:glycosyltransferase [Ammoniphilus sp. YIM 78166]